tara:strand:- start:1419 stop:2933 length:1515 start_codon:yes stop_codon:yes gene_type:complete
MSYLIDKTDLKANRYYRKVKLDIDELLDKFQAQEDLNLDKDIFGDDEGYFLVSNKLEDGYRVRFMTLENLIINKVLETEFNRGTESMKIKEYSYELDNIKKIPKRDLDLDEMDDKYVKLDISNIITELIIQYNTRGKKGIKLSEDYTENKVKTTKIKTPEKEKPKEVIKPISQEELEKKSIINNSTVFKNLLFTITNGSARDIAQYLTADDYNGNTQHNSALKAFKDYFKVRDLSKATGDKWNKILGDIVLEKYSKEEMEDLVYQMIKNEINSLDEEKQKLIKNSNNSVIFEDRPLLDHILLLNRLGNEVYNITEIDEKKLLGLIIEQMLSPTKPRLEQINITKNKLELLQEKDNAYKPIYNVDTLSGEDYLEGKDLIIAQTRLLNAEFTLIKAGLEMGFGGDINSNKDILEYFSENPYYEKEGNKYSDFTKFEKFAIEKGLIKKKKKKKLNIKPFRMEIKEKVGDITEEEEVANLEKIFDYDKKKLFEEFDFKFTPELKGLLI